ncbi:MAG: oligosaccharide flippase family protein, partial [Prevotellamassilia sp.]|nr:oligosaccharide flippase family protein [Prevotellamassilia sp.]
MLSNGTQQVVMLLVGVLLARRLEVSDYGMVAMLTVFSVLAQNLQESGFSMALCNKRDAEHRDFNAVFWLSVCISVVVYTVLFFCAPLIAAFNHTPELTLVARVIFLGFVVISFNTAHWAYLYKHLMVRERTISQVSSSLISSAIGLTSAFMGAGYWSLVAMDMGYKVSISFFYWYFSPWRPTFEFDLRPAFSLFKFSCKILLTNLLTTLNAQVLQALLGHFFPRGNVVGQYSQANKWSL